MNATLVSLLLATAQEKNHALRFQQQRLEAMALMEIPHDVFCEES